MTYKLVAYTPTKETFDAFYYGYGEVISQEPVQLDYSTIIRTTVDYKDDQYRAEYQAGRFWSGLYHAEVTSEDSERSHDVEEAAGRTT